MKGVLNDIKLIVIARPELSVSDKDKGDMQYVKCMGSSRTGLKTPQRKKFFCLFVCIVVSLWLLIN